MPKENIHSYHVEGISDHPVFERPELQAEEELEMTPEPTLADLVEELRQMADKLQNSLPKK